MLIKFRTAFSGQLDRFWLRFNNFKKGCENVGNVKTFALLKYLHEKFFENIAFIFYLPTVD